MIFFKKRPSMETNGDVRVADGVFMLSVLLLARLGLVCVSFY